jgi:Sap-like sulfolipid-1-addressing protein
MTSTEVEFALVALAAMMSPTTLAFSVFALVLGDRPLRTGFWFFLGAFAATLAIGLVAAFALGNAAASPGKSTPKTWVSVLDVAFGVLLLIYIWRVTRRPRDPQKAASMIERMSKVASSPLIAIIGAGAALANAGGFIPIALKDVSQLNPNAGEYIVDWVFFTLVSLLPLALSLVMLFLAHDTALRLLQGARSWLEHNARTVAAVILVLLAAALLRNGIVGLTS